VKHFFTASDGTYGYRRVHADLADEGTGCSPELVRQIMRAEGLVACQPRPFRVTTDADAEAAADMPDLVERDFTADRPGVKFVGDITYVHTWRGFVGGFNRSSQHLDLGGVWWQVPGSRGRRGRRVRGGSGRRIGRCARRCGPRAGRSPRGRSSVSSGG
jgi:hypothetical protein